MSSDTLAGFKVPSCTSSEELNESWLVVDQRKKMHPVREISDIKLAAGASLKDESKQNPQRKMIRTAFKG